MDEIFFNRIWLSRRFWSRRRRLWRRDFDGLRRWSDDRSDSKRLGQIIGSGLKEFSLPIETSLTKPVKVQRTVIISAGKKSTMWFLLERAKESIA